MKEKKITGDEETDAILNEMEDEGEVLPSFNAEQDVAEEEEETEEEEAEDEDEEESEDETPAEADAEEEDEDEDDEEKPKGETVEVDDDEEGDDDVDPKKPVWKRYKETKKALKQAQELIDTLQGSKSQDDFDKKISEVASKYKMPAEATKAIVELAAEMAGQKSSIDPKTRKLLEQSLKQSEHQAFWVEQDKAFEKDFTANVVPLLTRDGADLKAVRRILKDSAFNKGNETKSLVELYIASTTKRPGKKVTSEQGRSTSRRTSSVDLDNLEEINELDGDDFDRASEALANKGKSRIVRRGGGVL